MITSLDELAGENVWLAWRNETVGERVTKVPYSASGRGKGDSSNPETWGIRDAAQQRASQIVNGLGGGIGVVLGIDCDEGLRLGGVDLDTCLTSREDIEEWAVEVIVRFASYAEISPSGTGAKVYFLYRDADLARLRAMMTGEKKSGRKFARASSKDHPPAIEVYLSNRFFAFTGELLDDAVRDLRLVEFEDLAWLLQEFGPAFAAVGKPNGSASYGPRDQSRSGAAFRIGATMRRAGASYEEFCEAVRDDPETADWYAEKGITDNERELHRIWDKAGQQAAGKRFALDDFYSYLPKHSYIYRPTREHWPAGSVNSQLLCNAESRGFATRRGSAGTLGRRAPSPSTASVSSPSSGARRPTCQLVLLLSHLLVG